MNALLIERFRPMADGLAALFHPHLEVVIHDLASESVAYIANNLSRRGIGDDSALHEIDFDPSEAVIGPYEKVNWDGRRIRSVSIVARDDKGSAIGVLCINMDLSVFEAARGALGLFLDGAGIVPQPEKLFRDDWQERINSFLQTWLAERSLALSALSREQKRELVEALHAEGAFKGRSAADYVANLLGLGRATVFNYLKAIRAS